MKYLNKSDVNLSWTSFEGGGRGGVEIYRLGELLHSHSSMEKGKDHFRHICGFISASINTSSKNRPLFCVSWCFMVVGGDGDKRVEKLWTILGLKRQRQAAGRADDRFNMWRLRNGKINWLTKLKVARCSLWSGKWTVGVCEPSKVVAEACWWMGSGSALVLCKVIWWLINWMCGRTRLRRDVREMVTDSNYDCEIG